MRLLDMVSIKDQDHKKYFSICDLTYRISVLISEGDGKWPIKCKKGRINNDEEKNKGSFGIIYGIDIWCLWKCYGSSKSD